MQRLTCLLAAVAGLLCLACGPTSETHEVYDFVRLFPVADTLSETRRIDFGTPDATAHLVEGWVPGDEAGLFLWGVGERSSARFEIVEPRPLELRLRGRAFTFPDAPPQDVTVEVNGEVVGTVRLGPEFETVRVELPATRQRRGENRLSFIYSYAISPAAAGLPSPDERPLAVAWDDLQLNEPGTSADEDPAVEAVQARPGADPPVLTLPANGRVTYSLRLEPETEFVIDELRSRDLPTEQPAGRLLIELETDGAPPVRFELEAKGGEQRIELPGSGVARLALTALSNSTGDRFSGFHLMRPALHRDAPKHVWKASANVKASGRKAPINVVLYVIDTLRADHLGCYGYDRPTSPRIDAFAAEGTLFTNAIAQSSWTRPTVATLLTGLSPRVHGAVHREDALGRSVPTLASLLREHGYATAGFTANGNVAPAFGFGHDFDVYEHLPETQHPEVHRLADDVHRPALAWLDQRPNDQPFFLFVHTVDPHAPYVPRTPFRELFVRPDLPPDAGSLERVNPLGFQPRAEQEAQRQDLIDLYDAEIAFNDHQFGLLLEALENRGLASSTLVVLVADHGEEFLDHDGWQHGRSLYREQLHVPLIIRFPRHRYSGRVMDAPVRQLDVLPTILDDAGLAIPKTVEGRPLQALFALAPEDRRRGPVFSHLRIDGYDMESVIFEGRQWIRYLGRHREKRNELLAWTSQRQAAVAGDERLHRPFLDMLLDKAELLRPEATAPAEAAIDPELRERLQALGYLDAGP